MVRCRDAQCSGNGLRVFLCLPLPRSATPWVNYWENGPGGWVNKRVNSGGTPVVTDFPSKIEANPAQSVPEPSNAIGICFMLGIMTFGARRSAQSRRPETPS